VTNSGPAEKSGGNLMSKRERGVHSQETSYRLAHSISDATKITGVGRSFIYEEIKEGRLRIRKAGRRSLIFDSDLKAWLASLPEKKTHSNTPKQEPGRALARSDRANKVLGK
jgi:excisionase family DNA binding protein